MQITDGKVIDEIGEEWEVECPNCGNVEAYQGSFDSSLKQNCENCKSDYKINSIYFDDESYID